ncbi:MAG: DUF4258 domain-containing protein [Deltaproteobacteria bacterium]|nr:DUF4258 domain-containing protein [Deltaproteobacteria bacterium]
MIAEAIKNNVKQGRYSISFTHTEKLRARKIEARHIEEAVQSGVVIESYPADPRGLSCLMLGYTKDGVPLHIVCGNIEGDEVLIVTAYKPDNSEWEEDWKTRRK